VVPAGSFGLAPGRGMLASVGWTCSRERHVITSLTSGLLQQLGRHVGFDLGQEGPSSPSLLNISPRCTNNCGFQSRELVEVYIQSHARPIFPTLL
jgi:hypothetical protein